MHKRPAVGRHTWTRVRRGDEELSRLTDDEFARMHALVHIELYGLINRVCVRLIGKEVCLVARY